MGPSTGTPTPEARVEFWYGPDGARLLKRESWDDDDTQKQSLTVYLFGGVYEEVHPLHDGDTEWHRKLQANSAALIRVIKPTGLSATETIEYLHRDHLGSVHKVTDGQGNTLHDLAFDPFGGRRESDWSGDVSPTTLEAILDGLGKNTSRGFTDHEQLDRTCFIHMNGRVYDPRIGRFVQPDPTFSQDFHFGDVGKRMLQSMHRAIAAFAAASNDLIIDDLFLETDTLDDYRDALDDFWVLFVAVRASLDVVQQREASRPGRFPGTALSHFEAVHAHGLYDLAVDTRQNSPEACAAEVSARLDADAPPTAFDELRALQERG